MYRLCHILTSLFDSVPALNFIGSLFLLCMFRLKNQQRSIFCTVDVLNLKMWYFSIVVTGAQEIFAWNKFSTSFFGPELFGTTDGDIIWHLVFIAMTMFGNDDDYTCGIPCNARPCKTPRLFYYEQTYGLRFLALFDIL